MGKGPRTMDGDHLLSGLVAQWGMHLASSAFLDQFRGISEDRKPIVAQEKALFGQYPGPDVCRAYPFVDFAEDIIALLRSHAL